MGLLLGAFGLPAHPMSHSSLPHPGTGPFPASHGLPILPGRCVALATRPSPPRPLVPSSRVYTPPGRLQPCGAGPLEPFPSGDRFVRLARVAPFPTPSLSPVPRPRPNPLGCRAAPSHPSSRVYTPPGRQQPCGAGPLEPFPSGDRFVRLARVALLPTPSLSHVARPRPNPLGCRAAPSHPSSRVCTPPGRQQPCGAGPLDPHPSGDRFVRLARVAPFPPFSPVPRPRPNPLGCRAAPPHPSSRVSTPPGRQQPCGAGPLDPHPSGDRFVRLARVAPFPTPSLSPVPRARPNPLGCRAAPSHPSSRVYTPPGRQQPCGAGPLQPFPSGDRFVRLARVAPFPTPSLSPVPRPRPNPLGCRAAPSHPSSRVYTPPGRQQPCGAGPLNPHPSGDRFVRLAQVAPFPPFSPVPRPRPDPLGCCAARPHPLIPCFYPTGPPATLWRGPTGSSSIRGPFCAPSTGRSPPAPASHSCAASHAVLVPWSHRVALATRPFLSRLLVVLRGVVRVFFFFLPRFFPRGSLLPACTHNKTASPSVSVPLGALVQSHRYPVARPLAVPGHARRPSLLARVVVHVYFLSPLYPPLPSVSCPPS